MKWRAPFICFIAQLAPNLESVDTFVHVNRTVKRLREGSLAVFSGRSARLDVAGLHRIARPLLDVFEKTTPEFGVGEAAAA